MGPEHDTAWNTCDDRLYTHSQEWFEEALPNNTPILRPGLIHDQPSLSEVICPPETDDSPMLPDDDMPLEAGIPKKELASRGYNELQPLLSAACNLFDTEQDIAELRRMLQGFCTKKLAVLQSPGSTKNGIRSLPSVEKRQAKRPKRLKPIGELRSTSKKRRKKNQKKIVCTALEGMQAEGSQSETSALEGSLYVPSELEGSLI